MSADLSLPKLLKERRSFTLETMRRKSADRVKPKPAAMLIIGFDAEWVTEDPDLAVDDDGDEDDPVIVEQIPRNRILSYQYACHYNRHRWSGIVYTRAGARIRYPGKPPAEIMTFPERINFADLLATAIERGIKEKHSTRWPRKIVAAAHWTRADLSAMADFAMIKRQFDGVQKTYVTLSKSYPAHVNVAGHIRKFEVSLVDTQLLVPGSASGSNLTFGTHV